MVLICMMALPFQRMAVLNCIVTLLLLSSEVYSFNIDVPSFVMHTSPQPDSWFGFSVAMYKHQGKNALLIGAPRYDTTQPGVYNGGAVLNCSTEFSNSCQYVPFDLGGSNVHQMGFPVDDKSDQFFGMTLRASNKDGIVVACAPRYVWFTETFDRREPVGTCYVAREELTDFQEISPCRTLDWGYHKQGFCQAGFDVALSKGGDRLFIGAPGAYYWQGQIHSQSLETKTEYLMTGEGPASEDDQYLGYSVAAGDYDGDGIEDVALGVPKANNYTGKIALYSSELTWLQNITGDQLGSYFGYSVAVSDFNNDGFDDIVVGSPLYTDYEDKEMKIEVGRVHILMQNKAHLFRKEVIFDGLVSKGRFGLSVASLGDINLDGFGDIAVGAPYGGEDGLGAVFIYHGFSTFGGRVLDYHKKPVQVLYASDVGRGFSTFGWSLSGGVDMDGNQYPDLLVGAYESERAFFFRSRPIINFSNTKLSFKSEGKTIDIGATNCEIRPAVSSVCVDLTFCLNYTGINVDDEIELQLEYHLDIKKVDEQRMLFESNEQGVFRERRTFTKLEQKCRTLKTFVKPGVIDKLTPITANVTYTLVERIRTARSLSPVLNIGQDLILQDSLTIQKNCGKDNICIPDLVLTFDAPDVFTLGKKEMLSVSVLVENRGEDAFESEVYISEPRGLLFNKFVALNDSASVTWTTNMIEGENFIVADVGNPLPHRDMASFTIFFQQAGALDEPRFEFLVTANSTNAENSNTAADNVIRKVIDAKIDAQLTLFGTSVPETLIYNLSHYQVPLKENEKHIGPSLIHKYGILSKGPSDISEAEIVIMWPSRTQDGHHLLYLVEQPITVGNVQCDYVDVNPLGFSTLESEERAKVLRLTNTDDFSGSSSVSSGSDISSSYSGGSSSSSSTSTVKEHSSSSHESHHYSSSSGSGHSSSGGYSYAASSGSEESLPDSSGGSSGGYEYSAGSSGSNAGFSGGSEHSAGTTSDTESRLYVSSALGADTKSGSSNQESSSADSEGRKWSTSKQYSYSSSTGDKIDDGQSFGRGGIQSGQDESTYYSSSSGTKYSSTGHRGYNPSIYEDNYSSSRNEGTSGSRQYTSGTSNRGSYSSSSGDETHRTVGSPSSSGFNHYSAGRGSASYNVDSSGGGIHTASSGSRYYSPSTRERTSSGRGVYSSTGSNYNYSSTGGSAISSSGGSFSGGSSSGDASHYVLGGGGIALGGVHSRSHSSDGSGLHGVYSSKIGDTHSLSDSHDFMPQAGGSVHKSSQSSSSSYSYSSDSLPGSHEMEENFNHIRRKRDLHKEDEWSELTSECGQTLCTKVRCRTGKLSENDDIYIYMRSRLWMDSIQEDSMFNFPHDDITITTIMVARANVVSHGLSEDYVKVYSKKIITPIRDAKSLDEAPPIPWWVILLATLAGLLILLLIILVLWKCGYFKRHRPRHKARIQDDSQPLNPPCSNGSSSNTRNGTSNGHHRPTISPPIYPGDEAL